MSGGWQISAGDVSESLRPVFYILSALASAWVFASARRQRFRAFAVWSWAAATFFLPTVALPLYLVARLFARRDESDESINETDESIPDEEEAREKDEESSGERDEPRASEPLRRRLLPPLLYAAALLLAGGIYFYQDYQSFDAHLARAARAKLYGRRARTIGEYRAALRAREDAHTRKLLGLELLDDGRAGEAVAELRAAEAGGEFDEMLAYHIGSALEAAGRREEAAASYLKFLRSEPCARTPAHARCEAARARVPQSEDIPAP